MRFINLSVIIPAYNASATIGRTLTALANQDYSSNFEVIVVDDGSSDDTFSVVSSFPAVRYVRQDNAGPASARNHGARLAQGDLLAFTDSDCVPHSDWISQLTAGFTVGDCSKPSCTGVVAGSYGIANPENDLAQCIYAEIVWRHVHLMPDFPNAFGSYNFCVKKNVFEAVGGFNCDYPHASGEDNDLSYKIVKAGWRIYFQRQALVDHYHPTLVIKYLKEQFRHGFWRVKMYADHPGMVRGDGYTYWKDVVEIPWAACFVLGLILSVFHGVSSQDVGRFVLLPLGVFEILCAVFITHRFFQSIFFGFILFLRALVRMFGFSTGILYLCRKKCMKNL